MVGAAVALVTLGVYVTTIGPTVTGEDSGELITAAYTLGIAHPPGYPIWCLLGKLFTFIPYGTIAWRVAFMSAFFGAAAAGLASVITIRITNSYIGGIAAGLLMAFSKEFWEQSVISEVYSLNAFFMLLCLLILLSWIKNREPWRLYLLAFVYGLGMANHNTMHFLAPVFVVAVFAVDRRPWLHWERYCKLAALALGTWMLINLYLPIRSHANPPVDWGNPETWQGFWDQVLRQQYSFGFKKNPHSFGRLAMQIWTLLKLYSREFTYFLAVLPLLGLYPLWKRHKAGFLLVTGLLVYVTAGFLFVLNFNLDKESIWVNNVFFIPTYILAAVLMGAAIAALADAKWRKFRFNVPAAILAVSLPILPLSFNYYWNDKSDYWFAFDYGVNIFKSLEENAVYFPVADHATFPLIYLQAVEGIRPDVIIANKYGYPEELFVDQMPYDLRVLYGRIPSENDNQRIEDWVMGRGDRPVYFTRKRPIAGLPEVEMRNCGIVYKAAKSDEPPTSSTIWDTYEWHTLDPASHRREYTAEAVLSDYYFFHGRCELDKGNRDAGLADLRTSLEIAGGSKETFNNLGSACAEYGELDEAAYYLGQAIMVDPDYPLALANAAKVNMQRKAFKEALPLIERAIKGEADNLDLYWMLAQCQDELGRYYEAAETLEKLVELIPNDARAYRQLGMLHLNRTGQKDLAKRYFSQSLRLDPNQPELLNILTENQSQLKSVGIPGMPKVPGLPEVSAPEMPAFGELPSGGTGENYSGATVP